MHSGWYYPRPQMSMWELKHSDIFIPEEYDEWASDRDGMRDSFGDKKKIKEPKNKDIPLYRDIANKRQKRLLRIRKAKRSMRQAKNRKLYI